MESVTNWLVHDNLNGGGRDPFQSTYNPSFHLKTSGIAMENFRQDG